MDRVGYFLFDLMRSGHLLAWWGGAHLYIIHILLAPYHIIHNVRVVPIGGPWTDLSRESRRGPVVDITHGHFLRVYHGEISRGISCWVSSHSDGHATQWQIVPTHPYPQCNLSRIPSKAKGIRSDSDCFPFDYEPNGGVR